MTKHLGIVAVHIQNEPAPRGIVLEHICRQESMPEIPGSEKIVRFQNVGAAPLKS
jgi:hypothetical protein